MHVGRKRKDAAEARPRAGDSIVTLRVEVAPADPVERKVELLGVAFAKTLQGSCLRRVLVWDVVGGSATFISGQNRFRTTPVGSVNIEIQAWSPEAEQATTEGDPQ